MKKGMVSAAGLEPAASTVSTWRSNQAELSGQTRSHNKPQTQQLPYSSTANVPCQGSAVPFGPSPVGLSHSFQEDANKPESRQQTSGKPEQAALIPPFTITSPPRTKKTSQRIVRFGKHKEHIRVMPSKAYCDWEKEALTQAPLIKAALRKAGVETPITDAVSVAATFYRDANRGDVAGFLQALGDYLQKAGILADDVLIDSWDGSRLKKDGLNPRIEVCITALPGAQRPFVFTKGGSQ